ncbi:MAG TPA: class I SAM-dependent methyltransferase, partial [Acidobacteriaceae bacterium]
MTEWDASEYAKLSALQQEMAAEVLSLIHLSGTERVLDIGCGNGKVTAEIAARVPQGSVLGVDSSSDMIAFASSHFDATIRPNLRFEVADARRLPFREEFDLIVSFNALHWIPEQEQALRSIHSAMKPLGRAKLRLVPKGERKSLEDVIEDARRSPRWSQYFIDFKDPYLHLRPAEYAALAEQNGLRVCELQVKSKSWDFGSRAGFQAFGSVTFVEWTRKLAEADMPDFIRDVLDRYQIVATDRPGEENT